MSKRKPNWDSAFGECFRSMAHGVTFNVMELGKLKAYVRDLCDSGAADSLNEAMARGIARFRVDRRDP